MAKGAASKGKSSASSATRKKQAAKKAKREAATAEADTTIGLGAEATNVDGAVAESGTAARDAVISAPAAKPKPRPKPTSAEQTKPQPKPKPHAKPNAGDGGGAGARTPTAPPARPAQRGQKLDKRSRKEAKRNRKRVYVPPPKPPQPPPDPLDALGLAKSLDPELVVLLRRASKKDVVTRTRALEGLLEWVNAATGTATSNEEDAADAADRQASLVTMLPCWVHLFPRLAISPTRRLRLLTAQIHAALLAAESAARYDLLSMPQYVEDVVGSFAVLAFDTDRAIARVARETWGRAVAWQTEDGTTDGDDDRVLLSQYLPQLVAHLSLLLLTPSASAALSAMMPALGASASQQGSGAATPTPEVPTAAGAGSLLRDAKNRDESNVEEDRGGTDARLVAGALGALAWVVETAPSPKPAEELDDLVSSAQVWSNLTTGAIAEGEAGARRSLGGGSQLALHAPPIRVRAWALLASVVRSWPEALDEVLSICGAHLLSDAWQERDPNVQRSMLDAVLVLVRARPDVWSLEPNVGADDEEGSEGDEDGEDSLSADESGEEETTLQESAEKDYEEVSAASDSDEDEEDEAGPADAAGTGDKPSSANGTDAHAALKPLPAAIEGFLAWLETACAGSPSLGYPAALVLFSTMPAPHLPVRTPREFTESLDRMFAPLDARLIDADVAGQRALVAAFVECAAWLGNRIFAAGVDDVGRRRGDADREAAARAVDEQLGKVWDEFVLGPVDPAGALGPEQRRLRRARIAAAGEARVAGEMAGALRRLTCGPWGKEIVRLTEARARSALQWFMATSDDDVETHPARARLLRLLGALRTADAPALSKAVSALASDISSTLANVLCHVDSAPNPSALVGLEAELIATFAEEHAPGRFDAHDALLQAATSAVPDLMAEAKAPPAVVARFYGVLLRSLMGEGGERAPTDDFGVARVWSAALSPALLRPEYLVGLMEMTDSLPSASVEWSDNRSKAALEAWARSLTERPRASELSPAETQALKRLLDRPERLIKREQGESLLRTFTSQATAAVEDRAAPSPRLALLADWLDSRPGERARELAGMDGVPQRIFSLALLDGHEEARRLWARLATVPRIGAAVATELRGAYWDVRLPLVKARESARELRRLGVDADALLPEREAMERAFVAHASTPVDAALAIVDPLVPFGQGQGEDDVETRRRHEGAAAPQLDEDGLSGYARAVLALAECLVEDRALARRSVWTLPHLILLAVALEDRLLLPTASAGILGAWHDRAALEGRLQRLVRLATFVLSALASDLGDDFHGSAARTLGQLKADAPAEERHAPPATSSVGQTETALRLAWREAAMPARVFARLLSGLLSFTAAGEAAGVGWLRLAQSVQSVRPLLAQAVLHTVKPLVQAAPVYDRLRNELASSLSGVPPSRATEQGLPLLRLLLAAAPPEDSEVAVLPPQRSIFLIQAMQRWMASDEAFPAEVDARLAQLLVALLPVVQGVEGSHLDFALDLAESSLEAAGLADDAELPATLHGLVLARTLRDLALRNATLRPLWKERREGVMDLVHALFLSLPQGGAAEVEDEATGVDPEAPTSARTGGRSAQSVPRERCLDVLIDLLRDLPPGRFRGERDLDALVRLVVSSSLPAVQVVSYRTLSATIREGVRDLVVEMATAGVAASAQAKGQDAGQEEGEDEARDGSGDKPATTKAGTAGAADVKAATASAARFPAQLKAAIVGRPDLEAVDSGDEAACRALFGYLLAWLAVFDHFEEASLQVRGAYAAELHASEALARSLLPTVFELTRTSGSTTRAARAAAAAASGDHEEGADDEDPVAAATAAAAARLPFDPSPFVLDEVFLDDVEPTDARSLRLLAAHVYLRALLQVPSAVREWWFSIKDRQLASRVSELTVAHCSPLVAASELAQLRDPASLAEVEDESMSVRVASGSSWEVVATYTIDDHPMEIGVRVPRDYPLRPLEVQAKERVGVSEQQLRSWLLLMTMQAEQTGRIFDAILLFKKNAQARFEGYMDGAECAICYSIVSPNDRSLPNKPCKTCKKHFHASCLFKWVSTSGSSTCPLCRSIL